MAAQVIACLQASPAIGRVYVLSSQPITLLDGSWRQDLGAGLNAELERQRSLIGLPLLVIHADLPLVTAGEIALLLEAAEENGAAIAPDRHRTGTNAIALARPHALRFCFGEASFARHRASGPAVFDSGGLALDVDTSADLDAALALQPHLLVP